MTRVPFGHVMRLLALAATLWVSISAFGRVRAHAESLADVASRAADAFWAQEYPAAARDLQKLADDYGVENATVYYNLGVTYAKQGKVGRAIHALRRAQKLDPDDSLSSDIAANLTLLRSALQERYRKELPEAQFVFTEAESLSYRVFHAVPAAVSRWAFASCWALALLALAAWRLGWLRFAPRAGGILWALGALTALTGAYALGASITARDATVGVVVAAEAELRDGRHPDAPTSPLPEGLEVRVTDSSDPQWIRVELSTGRVGWVTREDVAPI